MSINGIGQIDRWVPEVWNSYLLMKAKKESFWMKMLGGAGSGSAVISYPDLVGKPGDKIHLPTSTLFSGEPITADTGAVEGQGQSMSPDEITATLNLRRFVTEWTDVAETYGVVNLYQHGMDQLSYQMANFIDQEMFEVATTSHTYNVYGGSASADSDLNTTDTFNVAAARRLRAELEDNRAYPLGNTLSGAMFGIVVHARNRYNLITDSTFNTIVEYADVRGDANTLFSGKIPMIDGTLIFVNRNVPCDDNNSSDASADYTEDGISSGTENVSLVYAFGADALGYVGKIQPKVGYGEYDYGTKKGLVTSTVYGLTLLQHQNSCVGHYYATAL